MAKQSEITFFEKILNFNNRLDMLLSFLSSTSDFTDRERTKFSGPALREFGLDSAVGREYVLTKFIPEFENLLYKSFVVTLLILFEDELNTYCDGLREQLNIASSWNEIGGTPMERLVAYTTRTIGIKLAIEDEVWKKIDSIIALRYCILNLSGRLTNYSDAKKIKNFSKSEHGLKIQGERIVVCEEFCRNATMAIREFVESLYNSAISFVRRESLV